MLHRGDAVAVYLRQTVDIVVAGSRKAEVLREVDYLHALRYAVFLEKSLALAVAEAEEHHVNLIERHFVCKYQICVANESFVYVGNGVACIALAVGEDDFGLRVVYQQADKFTAGVACRT